MTRRLSLLLLVGCVCALSIARGATRNVPFPSAEATNSSAADSLLLDQYPDAHAAYSLRKLRSDYSGPVLRVRRTSDNAEQDIGFDGDWIDSAAIESFVGSGEGRVTTWYDQTSGGSMDLTQGTASSQPVITEGGSVITDNKGNPAIFLKGSDTDDGASELDASGVTVPGNDYTFHAVIEETRAIGDGDIGDGKDYFGLAKDDVNSAFRGTQSRINGGFCRFSGDKPATGTRSFFAIKNDGSEAIIRESHRTLASVTAADNSCITDLNDRNGAQVGGGYEGLIQEFAVFPAKSNSTVTDIYRNVTSDWQVGAVNWNEDAILPQQYQYQVDLYNWIAQQSEQDLTLPDGTISWDGTYSDSDELADLWLMVEGLSASSATRSHPGWYVLDNGNGKGIEATGSVKVPWQPNGNGQYGGNPARSWANEPAHLYRTSIPLSGGGEGNPWYQNEAVGKRALIIAMVDMMQHHRNWQGSSGAGSGRYDMFGKASVSWAEVYRWVGDILPPDVQEAYEKGFEFALDRMIEIGPEGVNTNMDMFAIKAQAEFYMATDDPTRKQKSVKAAKRALLGATDGELGSKHDLYAISGDGGVFRPSGVIMEGGQAEVFYGGESIYQIQGALQAVTDRSTGSVQSDWAWLDEVARRLQEWRTYQHFYDPKPGVNYRDQGIVTAGAGFGARTSYGVPKGQSDEVWRDYSTATAHSENAFKAKGKLKSPSDMQSEINNRLSYIDGEMDNTYTSAPSDWDGWSPWTKKTPYLPKEGWYSALKTKDQNDNPEFETYPHSRSGNTFNKVFGGHPTGPEYWSYVDQDGEGNRFGFFLEAQAQQGVYGGWYGGKIESFWTEATGLLLINRHGKSGCDRSGVDDYSGSEDSECWFNLDEKAAQHVWGRDENGNGFTTLLVRGYDFGRTSSFNDPDSPTTATITTPFNDPNVDRNGMETSTTLEGSVDVENKFEVQSNGLKVTHTLTSDETDQVTELWASFPVYLRHNNPHRAGSDFQSDMNDTRIEYWDGSGWVELPFDTDSDGVPEIVSTDALRLGRDYEDGEGMRYAYVSLASTQDLRRSKHKYYDPYQSKTGVRTVHIDLHGDPGTTKTLPASKSVSYTIQTTEPALGALFTEQDVSLRKGSNLISAALAPEHAHMDSVFAGVAADVVEVKNEAGERYRPADGVNEIGHWDRDEAYVVYAESGATLSLQGTPVDTSSIALDEGWNWVPYSRSSALAVEEALTSIQDVLVMVKDEAGRAYVPGEGIEELSTLTPGEGYRVYVSSSTTLTYPAGSN
ncbi:hypothetical protein GGP73_001711 [Salinibacter ruber]|nr:arabinofuranosidase catalytic domain-containing protein [Salinibacter ruber]MCS3697016.1 hypothetical protein [Salinibacter ruber]